MSNALFEKRARVFFQIHTTFTQLGYDPETHESYEIEIKAHHWNIDVRIYKIKDNGTLFAESNFQIDCQQNSLEATLTIAEDEVEQALRNCGAVFTTLKDLKK